MRRYISLLESTTQEVNFKDGKDLIKNLKKIGIKKGDKIIFTGDKANHGDATMPFYFQKIEDIDRYGKGVDGYIIYLSKTKQDTSGRYVANCWNDIKISPSGGGSSKRPNTYTLGHITKVEMER